MKTGCERITGLDPSKLSAQYRVRRLDESDAKELLAFCLQNDQYYRYCGKQPSKEQIFCDLHLTPPDTSAEDKYYVGFYDRDVLVAIMDLIDGYPDRDTAFIGFFMMNRQLQGRQLGSRIEQEVCIYLREMGLKRVLLGIDKDNPQSNHFWAKNGFSVIREAHQEEGVILVAEKSL